VSFARRPNPVFSPEYRALISVLAAARKQAGVTQRGLAAKLGKANSHVQRIECGQRRLDVLEFYQIARLLELDPASLFIQIASKLDALGVPDTDCGEGSLSSLERTASSGLAGAA
jgi:transcriptional regulator with XRE-family HTH domain